MVQNIIITYALMANGVNIYSGIEFNSLIECEDHIYLFDSYDEPRCVKIVSTEY